MILVGFSLSLCVGDLLSGRQAWPEGQRIVLVACTKFPNPEAAYAKYGPSYWMGYSKEVVMALLERLWPYVVQPRLINNDYDHFAGGGAWFTTATLNPREITNTISVRDEESGRVSMLDRLDDEVLLVPLWGELLRVIRSQRTSA